MTDTVPRTGYALCLLRLVTGFGFAAHGYAKLARGPEQFAVILTALHVPMPHLAAWATTLLELGGGIALMAGAFVPFVAVPLAAILLTATATVHWQYGFSSIRLTGVTPAGATFGPIGYELDLLYLTALLAVAVAGPGAFALDRRIVRTPSTSDRPA